MCDKRLVVAMVFVFTAASAMADDEAVEFKGYYKNLLTRSRTAFPVEEDYTLDLNRLRIEARGQPREWLGFEVQYDNEVRLGDYLDTAQFHHFKMMRPQTYWDLEDDYADHRSLHARHRLYRGFISIKTPVADIFLGRQRIAWGAGRFWNPTDLFNPFSPIQLEREERIGVDAVLVEHNIDALSKLSAAYAPSKQDSSAAVRVSGNATDTDYAVMVGEFEGDDVVGVEFAGRAGQAGVRAEATHTRTEPGARYTRALVGIEYAFQNTLTVSFEYYYNGAGSSQRARYDFTGLFTGAIHNVARHYLGSYAKYEITPLLRWDNYLVANLDDHSRFYAPSLVYSVAAGVDWSVGMQLFDGSQGSEYGMLHNVFYTQLQWFF